MDTLSTRIDVLSNRMDALGADLSARINKVYQNYPSRSDIPGLTPTTLFKPC